jgi:xylulokinase
MEKDYLIGIDIGSTNVKTVIFDKDCHVLASETQEYTTLIPRPGWTEYDPEEWWDGVKNTLNRAIQNAGIDPNKIAGLGVSSLGCCPVPMDEGGNVIYNGIPWSDQRAQDEVNFLIDNCKDIIFKTTKNTPTTMNATPHLMWIKNNEPEIYKKIYKYSEPSGFLGQRFTDEFTLDLSFASSLDFGFDVNILDYNEDLINTMGLDIDKYPRLHKNAESLGSVTEKAAKETGIVEGIPVFSGGPDFTPGALAAGALHSGQGYYSMGSGANMIVLTDDLEVASPYLISIIHAKGPELRMLDGVQGSIGYSIRWFRDQLGGLEQEAATVLDGSVNAFEIMTAEGLKTEPGAGGIVYLPYLFGKFHPVLNPNAKGVFFGISPISTRPQIIRAIMEGCSFAMYQSLKNSLKLGLKVDEIIATGGPSKSDLWCQIMADVTNTKIVTVNAPEAAPFGDAILAGVGAGLFKSFEEVAERAIKINRVYEPVDKNHNLYEDLFTIYEDVYESLYDNFDKLEEIKAKHGVTK